MGAAMIGKKEAEEKRLREKEIREKYERIENIKREKLPNVRRAMEIISEITGCSYNPNQDFIKLGHKFMKLCLFDTDDYPIALIHSHSCREWIEKRKIMMQPGNEDGEIIRKSINRNNIIEYLAYIAGYSYPDKAEKIDSALENLYA